MSRGAVLFHAEPITQTSAIPAAGEGQKHCCPSHILECQKSLFEVVHLLHFSFLCDTACQKSCLNTVQVEKLNPRIRICKQTYKHIYVHMLTWHAYAHPYTCLQAVLNREGAPHITDWQPDAPTAPGGGGSPHTSAAKVLNLQGAVTGSVLTFKQCLDREVRTTRTQFLSPQRFCCLRLEGQRKLWCFTMHREFQKETEESIWQPPPFPLPPFGCWGFKGVDEGRFIHY